MFFFRAQGWVSRVVFGARLALEFAGEARAVARAETAVLEELEEIACRERVQEVAHTDALGGERVERRGVESGRFDEPRERVVARFARCLASRGNRGVLWLFAR